MRIPVAHGRIYLKRSPKAAGVHNLFAIVGRITLIFMNHGRQ